MDIEWLENGFFINKGDGAIVFIKYDNIYQIHSPFLYEEEWNVVIDYVQKCRGVKDEEGFRFPFPTKEEAEPLYHLLITKWKEHQINLPLKDIVKDIKDKLDKLLSHIDVLPGNETGGKDFEEAKERFVEIKESKLQN